MPRDIALVLGCGDVGSAIAIALLRAGFGVALADEPRPAHIRRGMAFTDAWFHGSATLDGVGADLTRADSLEGMLRPAAGRILAIELATDHDLAQIARRAAADLLVDARMRKRGPAPVLRRLAPLTVGAGPGFVAGEQVDAVIETAWGAALGQARFHGAASDYDGRPREVAGHGRDRYLYVDPGGIFRTSAGIGQRVAAGEIVGSLDGRPCAAPLDGVLRGLSADGAMVRAGKKVIEVDPAGDVAGCFGISPRAARIAQGVLAALDGPR